MANPTIEELQNSEDFELIAELDHSQIKEFVIDRLTTNSGLTRFYMYYQTFMILLGIFILTRGIVFAFRETSDPLWFALGALVFSFTFMIPIHEMLHGLAIKFTGAQKVNYGAYLRKFIFYAEADRHVMNRNQFRLVALAPLVVVQVFTLIAGVVLWNTAGLYFVAMIMSVHSLFCAGDIGLLSIFYAEGDRQVFTFDIKAEKKSYYYRRKES